MMVSKSQAWEKGVEDFNLSRYWEAHENWEVGWKELPSPHKEFHQGLIQLCGCLVHLKKKNVEPAVTLAQSALNKFKMVHENGGVVGFKPRVEITESENFCRNLVTSAGLEKLYPREWLESAVILQARLIF